MNLKGYYRQSTAGSAHRKRAKITDVDGSLGYNRASIGCDISSDRGSSQLVMSQAR